MGVNFECEGDCGIFFYLKERYEEEIEISDLIGGFDELNGIFLFM